MLQKIYNSGVVPIICVIGMVCAPAIPEIGEKLIGFFAGVLFTYGIIKIND